SILLTWRGGRLSMWTKFSKGRSPRTCRSSSRPSSSSSSTLRPPRCLASRSRRRCSREQDRSLTRRLASHEVDLPPALRLRALRDAPDSFGETFAAAAVRPISYWEELTRSVTEPGGDVMFLAYEGDDVLGSAYGLLDRARTDAGRVGGMWVGPDWRRRGVGRALL